MPNDQGLDLDQIIQQTSAGWKQVGDPVAETQMATDVTGAQKPTPTGRWLVTITDGTHSRQLILRPQRVEGPTGKVSWSLEEGPKDVSGSQPRAPDVTTPAETTWVDVPGAAGQTPQQQGHRIVDGQLVPIPGLTRAKPATDTSGAPQWIPDPQDPNKEIQVVYSGTTAIPVSANGAVVSRPKKAEGPTNVGGARWIPDPKNPANEIEVVTTLSPDGTPTNKPTGASRKAPATAPTAAGNVIWQDIPDQPGKQQGGTLVEGKFVPVEGLTKDKDKKPVAVYGTGPNDKFRIVLDEDGKVVSKEDNPNYVGEKPTQLQADLVAPNIPLLKPDGTIQWVENKNRVPANQAMYDLMDQLHVKVNDRQMSMADAKDLLTGAVNAMNATTAATNAATAQQTQIASAANDVLANTRGNAQTGAGLLNQRVQSATGALQNIIGSAAGSNMMNAPAGLGQRLVGGLQAFTTELGGGQAVYDTAARMVQAADPKISGDPTLAQQAQQALAQMFQVYQQQNGRPAPQVAATQAAQQSQQTGGMAAPATTATPVQQPAAVASGQVAPPAQVPGQNYGNSIAYTGGVAPSQYGYTPVGANYSYGGPVPWVGATPRPLPPGTPTPFVAPVTI